MCLEDGWGGGCIDNSLLTIYRLNVCEGEFHGDLMSVSQLFAWGIYFAMFCCLSGVS